MAYAIIGLVAVLIGAALWLYLAGRSAGKDGVRADVAVKTVDTMKAQDKAAAEASAEDVVSRLRDGEF